MATFTAIRCKKQSASSMRGVIDYVEQEKKTRLGDAWLVSGSNCVPQSAFIEMQMTKERFRKADGTQFYHFVQSFSAEDNVTPQEANSIGLEFAQRQFPDFEVVVATHFNTGTYHNHFAGAPIRGRVNPHSKRQV
ncbi:MAG: relaxase/mobilization nuclease domain-containing protein [Oscillospiraceae bacterium]